jgi:hypothetical protein
MLPATATGLQIIQAMLVDGAAAADTQTCAKCNPWL